MLFFRKKNTKNLDLSWMQTDMHSHLVPGIDDGSQDLTTSVHLVRGLCETGLKKIITTPHILWEIYPNTAEKITNGIGEVREAVKEAGISVELHAAAEYFIDEHFEEDLKKKTPLLPISGNMVLVEISMINAPMDLHELLFEMQMQNYQPVIAHPERYVYLSRNRAFFDQLKDSGCLFQLNLLALTGYYGSSVRELAEYLLKKEYYDLAGTDLHNAKHLETLQKLSGLSTYEKLKDSGSLKNHLL
jgi:tyrosine-protein phosphatase YwqE